MRLFGSVFPSGVQAFFTDHDVDFSLSDDPALRPFTVAQRAHLFKLLPDETSAVATILQHHGTEILSIDSFRDLEGRIPRADGAVTSRQGIALSIRTADCLPVFAYQPEVPMIGLAHAGWRGTRDGIAAATAAKLFGRGRLDRTLIGFGPAIRSCCYEVGKEFRKSFPEDIEERAGRFYLDLVSANRRQLLDAGVSPDNIHDSGLCTCCDERFFSYRRQKENAGRHLSLFILDG